MTDQFDNGGSDSRERRYGQQPSRGGQSGGGGSSGGRYESRGPRRDDDRRGPPRSRQDQYLNQLPQDRDQELDDRAQGFPSLALRLPIGKTSRQIALTTLMAAVNSDEFVTDHLEQAFVRSDLAPIERRLATELTFGVVRRKATLDAILEKAVTRPRSQVETALWMLLRIGVYQLTICDGIPAHAACDETVELARWMGRPEWVSLANGVLRGISRSVLEEQTQNQTPSPQSVPTTHHRFRQLDQPIFADPTDKPLAYLAKAFSLPMWLLERWAKRFDFPELCRLGFWFNTPAPLCLRVNTLRTDRETVLAAFAEAGVAARPGELPSSIWLGPLDGIPRGDRPTTVAVESVDLTVGEEIEALLDSSGESSPSESNEMPTSESDVPPEAVARPTRRDTPIRIDRLPGFNEGWFVVQDESAQRVATLLAPQPGETVLDLCSAPGTKTTHLAELMRNEGRIIATDASAERLKRVDENCHRLGITIVETKAISNESLDIPEGPFDAILIDAPCSNTGVLGKRPDARWRIQADDLEELSRIQLRLLLAASDRLRPGGRILYSTCSIEPEENSAVIEAAVHFRQKLKLELMNDLVPGRSADGGFQSLLRSQD